MFIATTTLTVCYYVGEGRKPLSWFEYQVKDDVKRFVPIYNEQDRVKAKQFWKLNWDAPDLLGWGEEV